MVSVDLKRAEKGMAETPFRPARTCGRGAGGGGGGGAGGGGGGGGGETAYVAIHLAVIITNVNSCIHSHSFIHYLFTIIYQHLFIHLFNC